MNHTAMCVVMIAATVLLSACEGPQGEQGPYGPQGPRGDTGSAGIRGLTGPAGPEGPAGPAGPEGPAGPAGPEGPAGEDADNSNTGAIEYVFRHTQSGNLWVYEGTTNFPFLKDNVVLGPYCESKDTGGFSRCMGEVNSSRASAFPFSELAKASTSLLSITNDGKRGIYFRIRASGLLSNRYFYVDSSNQTCGLYNRTGGILETDVDLCSNISPNPVKQFPENRDLTYARSNKISIEIGDYAIGEEGWKLYVNDVLVYENPNYQVVGESVGIFTEDLTKTSFGPMYYTFNRIAVSKRVVVD
jgi:hypothetical protein